MELPSFLGEGPLDYVAAFGAHKRLTKAEERKGSAIAMEFKAVVSPDWLAETGDPRSAPALWGAVGSRARILASSSSWPFFAFLPMRAADRRNLFARGAPNSPVEPRRNAQDVRYGLSGLWMPAALLADLRASLRASASVALNPASLWLLHRTENGIKFCREKGPPAVHGWWASYRASLRAEGWLFLFSREFKIAKRSQSLFSVRDLWHA